MNAGHGGGSGPLAGWRVLVPRPVDRAGELVDALAAHGAKGVPVELISIAQPVDVVGFQSRVADLADGAFSWVGFTSVNAVAAVVDRLSLLGPAATVPTGTRVAAVGPATGAALQAAGLPVDLVPPAGGSAAALAAVWPPATGGDSVLLPRADIAAPLLPDALLTKGYLVQEVTAYRTVVRPASKSLAAALSAGGFDAVLFTSPSTVAALADVALPHQTVLGAIGKPTASALLAAGRRVGFTADRPSVRGLVDGLLAFAVAHPVDKKAEVRQ